MVIESANSRGQIHKNTMIYNKITFPETVRSIPRASKNCQVITRGFYDGLKQILLLNYPIESWSGRYMRFRCMFHETIHRQQAQVIFGVNYPISDNRRTISLDQCMVTGP